MTSVLILKRSGTKDMLEMERGEWKQNTLEPWPPDFEKKTAEGISISINMVD